VAIERAKIADQKLITNLNKTSEKLSIEVKQKTHLLNDALKRESERHAQFKRLSAMVSHEFRNPLSTIMARIELLSKLLKSQKRECPQDVNTQIVAIHQAGLRLKNLLNQWHMGDKVNDRILQPQLNKVNLYKLLHEIAESSQNINPYYLIDLDYPKQFKDYYVTLDEDLFKIALFNLIDNACKYSSEESQVRIEACLSDKSWEVKIIDQGRGIAEKDQHKIFDEYYRAQLESDNPGGLGLGLALVKRIVDAMQARIYVESELGLGSQFTVRFNVR
jgi:signal transduction histidine kinase